MIFFFEIGNEPEVVIKKIYRIFDYLLDKKQTNNRIENFIYIQKKGEKKKNELVRI